MIDTTRTSANGEVPGSGPLPPLVAIAHGSRDPRAGAAVAELLDQVRRRAAPHGERGLEVFTAYLDHAPPSPAQVLGALHASALHDSALHDSALRASAPRASALRASARPGHPGRPRPWNTATTATTGNTGHAGNAGNTGDTGTIGDTAHRTSTVVALPLLLTDAYHSKTDVPSVLHAAATTLPGLRIRYAATLGPHRLLITAMERRLRQAGVTIGDPRTAVVLASAGSSDPAAREVIAQLARDWQALRGWRDVVPAFASAASPSPAEAVTVLRHGGAAPAGWNEAPRVTARVAPRVARGLPRGW